MRWKQNLAFNNDDGKKLYKENYLHKKILKSSATTTIPPPPCFLFLFFTLWK